MPQSICLNMIVKDEEHVIGATLANILQKRSALFLSLYQHDNSEIRAWAKAQYSTLQDTINNEREWEENRNRERNESFE